MSKRKNASSGGGGGGGGAESHASTLERVALACVYSDPPPQSQPQSQLPPQEAAAAIKTYKQNLEKEENHFISRVDKMLEKERFDNKSEKWNRLDNSVRIEKLFEFADTRFEALFLEQYRSSNDREEGIRRLKDFFESSLKKKKLLKVKEIVYNRELGRIEQIPSLQYHIDNDFFYLKNNNTMDGNHISMTKSLTPKRSAAPPPPPPSAGAAIIGTAPF